MPASKKIRKKVAKKSKPLNISDEGNFLVVLEQMRDDIKIIAEGHSVLARGIDELKSDVAELKMDVAELKDRMSGMENRMSGMENRMDNFEGELKGLRKEMNQGFKMVFGYAERIEDEIKDVKKEIEILRKELKSKADVERLEILEKRVQRIERDYAIIMDKGGKKYETQ